MSEQPYDRTTGTPPDELTQLHMELQELDKVEPRPPLGRLVVMREPTTPALVDKLANVSPCAAILSDEAGTYFGGHSMRPDSRLNTWAVLNSIWDGRSISSERRSVESMAVETPRGTLGFAMQPAAMQDTTRQSHGIERGIGGMARFIFSNPESTQGTRKFREPSAMREVEKFAKRLKELLDIPLTLEGRKLCPPVLSFTPEAKAAWVEFHDEVEDELAPGGDMSEAKDVAAKAADNAARIAALLHIFENGAAGQIGLQYVNAATRLMTWHLYQFRRYFCELAPTPEMLNAQKLEDWLIRRLRQTGEVQTKTQAILNGGPSALRHRTELDSALQVLIRAKRARKVREGRTELVELNPVLLEAA